MPSLAALRSSFDFGSLVGVAAGAVFGFAVVLLPTATHRITSDWCVTTTGGCGCWAALGGCCACAPQKASVLPTSSVLSSVFFILFVV